MASRIEEATLENMQIMFRNFKGEGGPYNREGDRNFVLRLDEQQAQAMKADGWNVKVREPREQGDGTLYSLPVSVNFKGNRPPTIVLITKRNRATIPESLVEMLDYADIEFVDLILNPYAWKVNANTGIKAYLKAMYVTIRENVLEEKYAELEDVTPGRQTQAEIAGPLQVDRRLELEGLGANEEYAEVVED
jgi:hypothetical protein